MPRKPPTITLTHPISKELFERIEQAVREAGHSPAIDVSENIEPLPPANSWRPKQSTSYATPA